MFLCSFISKLTCNPEKSTKRLGDFTDRISVLRLITGVVVSTMQVLIPPPLLFCSTFSCFTLAPSILITLFSLFLMGWIQPNHFASLSLSLSLAVAMALIDGVSK